MSEINILNIYIDISIYAPEIHIKLDVVNELIKSLIALHRPQFKLLDKIDSENCV